MSNHTSELEIELQKLLKGIDYHNPLPTHIHGSPQLLYWTFDAKELMAYIQQREEKARISENEIHKAVIHHSDLDEELAAAVGICDDRIKQLTTKEQDERKNG